MLNFGVMFGFSGRDGSKFRLLEALLSSSSCCGSEGKAVGFLVTVLAHFRFVRCKSGLGTKVASRKYS